jgi:hypothetical protein
VKVSPALITGSSTAHIPGQSEALAGRTENPSDVDVVLMAALTSATLAAGHVPGGRALREE